jgi:hypothetical protein
MVASMMRILNFFIMLFMSLLGLPSFAQDLTDPTRPPFGMGNESFAQVISMNVKGLQSVLISHTRCSAIIDGKSILLGAKYGNEKLVEVSESGVVLQGDHGRRSLRLFPAVDIKITDAPPQKNKAFKCLLGMNVQEEMPELVPGQKEIK